MTILVPNFSGVLHGRLWRATSHPYADVRGCEPAHSRNAVSINFSRQQPAPCVPRLRAACQVCFLHARSLPGALHACPHPARCVTCFPGPCQVRFMCASTLFGTQRVCMEMYIYTKFSGGFQNFHIFSLIVTMIASTKTATCS